ncbi:succinate-semialdehyde dehydrogenase [Leptospira wolbachii serovar Codice str. CDC]|uniref:Succinate-semialdehyde dehydrogenase n=1 Tax=Leptospira wolbachii serovar Codice str. CDC TaxID=1218599 RepID=R9AED7_9LEPT|nr:NAD-dependent succinate-semialdehyde dehydrogenase [Leptospira wolbachii]EOQ98450.1 succinate-semialdehyde dehydrogenase [Leptospira wolbachii serovar Codice str. CDC]
MKYIKDKDLFRQENFIGGVWCPAENKKEIIVQNPANGEVIGNIPHSTEKDTWNAIRSAKEALQDWKTRPAKERAGILRKWFQLMIDNQEDLALIMTQEQGKPLTEARGEIAYAASYIEWFGEEAKRSYGDIIPSHRKDTRILVLKEPIGVVGTITPWNFPAAMLARKVAPALAAGCTVVSKPAELTPYSALAMAVLAERAGLPKGVWNVLVGDPIAIGKAILESKEVRKLSFTGSTKTGIYLMEKSAATLKKLSLELGGNAPFIVFEDADIDEAIKGAMLSKYRNTGQTCVCVNRFLVQASVAEVFSKKLAEKAKELVVANGMEPNAQQGPLINDAALEKVKSHIQDAVSKGAKILTGGKEHTLGGNFFEPTVLYPVNSSMVVTKEETFGPVSCIQTFQTEEEAIHLANDTDFGLASYLYTKDMARTFRVAEQLEYGMVGINEGLISSEQVPFGGVKFSGMGREGSKYGLDDYTVTKYLCLGGIK